MKKLFVALLLIAAFCTIAVSPVLASPSTNPTIKAVDSANPFWLPDYVPITGGTWDGGFNRTTYVTSTGKPLANAFNITPFTPSKGGTLANAFIIHPYICSSCRVPIGQKYSWEYN